MRNPNITFTLTLNKNKSEIKLQATNDDCTSEEILTMLRLIEPLFEGDVLERNGAYIEEFVKLEMSENNKPTFTALELLSSAKKKEEERCRMAIQLNICPECGADIVDERLEKKPSTKLFYFTINNDKKWDVRKICKNNSSHYEMKYDTDSYSPY